MGSCLTPFAVKIKKGITMSNETIGVPCGKCPECLKRRVSGWSFRLREEFKRATTAHFITLTYDTIHVPITTAGYMSCRKDDAQKFLKRLRNLYRHMEEPPTIKYYLAAEYGGRTNRPHYHAIIFNVPDPYDIDKAWGLGSVHFAPVNAATIGYTLKYMDKPKKIPAHRNDDRLPEFGLMSKRLGDNYINPDTIHYHHADLQNRCYLTIEDGKKIAMPRYYKQKIYEDTQRKAIAWHAHKTSEIRLEKSLARAPDYYAKKFIADKEQFRIHSLNFKKDKL